jgi:hypothetical protein
LWNNLACGPPSAFFNVLFTGPFSNTLYLTLYLQSLVLFTRCLFRCSMWTVIGAASIRL